MSEVEEAAKIITESIDKDAKVIFGAIKDDKLKKDEVKLTVIATGFPTNMPRKSSLFQMGNKEKEEKKETPAAAHTKEELVKKSDAHVDAVIDDGDSDWTAVPAFLRRGKK